MLSQGDEDRWTQLSIRTYQMECYGIRLEQNERCCEEEMKRGRNVDTVNTA